MADITNIITKISKGNKFNLALNKTYPWDNRRENKLKFSIELVRATTEERTGSIDLKILVTNRFLDGNRTTKSDFEQIFNTWEVQENLREKIIELYNLDKIGFTDLYMVGTEFIIL